MSESRQGISVDLSGQVAIVTGASRGLGRSIAEMLGASGATVVCVARNEEKLKEVASAIEAAGGKAEVAAVDVTDGEATGNTVSDIFDRHERIDILVNNAGITRDTLSPRMTDEDWDDVINTNLRAAFLWTRAVTKPMMQRRSGRIINMSSVSGIIGNPGQANYSASKAGLIGLTRTVARELAGRKITVNAICPGFIATEMTDALGPALVDEVKKRVPAKRLGQPEEIAQAVLYLASDAAAYITGHVLVVDGGLTA